MSETTSAGYTFIFSDPAGQKKESAKLLLYDDVDKFIHSPIEWGKLLLQLVVVGGAGFGAFNYMGSKQ